MNIYTNNFKYSPHMSVALMHRLRGYLDPGATVAAFILCHVVGLVDGGNDMTLTC